MFNKKAKQIKTLKNNLQKLNANRMEVANENRILQKQIKTLEDKYDKLISTLKEQNRLTNDLINELKGNKKLPKIETKEIEKVKEIEKPVNEKPLSRASVITNVEETIVGRTITPTGMPEKGTRQYKALEKELNDWIATDYKRLMRKTRQTQTSLSKILNVSSSSVCAINKTDRTTSLELKVRVRNLLTKLAGE